MSKTVCEENTEIFIFLQMFIETLMAHILVEVDKS